MAYIIGQDEEEVKKQGQVSGGGAAFAGGGTGGQAAPMAGGSGGQKQFANIQSYLDANKGQDFENLFQGAAGGELGSVTASSKGKTEPASSGLESERSRTAFDPNQELGKLYSAADSMKDYGGIAKNIYGQLKTQFNTPAFEQSAGAESAKKYGKYLESPDAFGTLSGTSNASSPFLESVYQNKAKDGQTMTAGQRALQQQIDVGRSSSFEPAKEKLLKQYKDYKDAMSREASLASDIGTSKSDFETRQRALKNALESALTTGTSAYAPVPGGSPAVKPIAVGEGARNVAFTPGSNVPGPNAGLPAIEEAKRQQILRDQRRMAAIRAALYGE